MPELRVAPALPQEDNAAPPKDPEDLSVGHDGEPGRATPHTSTSRTRKPRFRGLTSGRTSYRSLSPSTKFAVASSAVLPWSATCVTRSVATHHFPSFFTWTTAFISLDPSASGYQRSTLQEVHHAGLFPAVLAYAAHGWLATSPEIVARSAEPLPAEG